MTPEEIQQEIEKLSNLMNSSKNDEAVELSFKLLEIEEIHKNSESLAKVYSLLGLTYKGLSEYSKSIEYLLKALNLDIAIDRKFAIGGNLVNIGIVYTEISNYEKALEFLEKGLKILEEIDHKHFQANAINCIGNVYNDLSDYPKAIEYYFKSLQIYEDLGLKRGIGLCLGNIGNTFRSLCDYENALKYQLNALQINEEIDNKYGIAINASNLGIIYLNNSEYAKAIEYFEMSLFLNQEIGNKYGISIELINISEYYLISEPSIYNPLKAEECLQNALRLAEEIGAKAIITEIYEHLHSLHLNLKQFEASLEYKLQSISLEKEIQSIEVKKQAERFDIERKSAEREKQLAVERAEAETVKRILHNILPINIADRIIKQETFIADHFQSVSVLFMDLVGFTSLASIAPAKQLVFLLDSIFTKADEVVESFGLEKIKTIGDGYLAVANVTTPLEEHQKATALAALQLLETMLDFTVNIPSDLGKTDWSKNMKEIEIRIGIHTGEIVAGIIGKNKYTYDLWGDAVNVASRMESNSEAGRIHISNEFAKAIEQHPEFLLISRGEISIKGKGKMNTYWLEKAK